MKSLEKATADYEKAKEKMELDLPVPPVDDVDSLTVDPEPQLLIVCNYKKDTEGRKKRIGDIERILSSANISYRIDYCE